jgi:glycosyltransferase involved in cell wall biosynthesis
MHDILDQGKVNRLFIRIAGWGAARIICVSDAVKINLLEFGVPVDKCRVIHNCLIDPPASKQQGNEGDAIKRSDMRLVGMIGNLCPWKGQLVFAEAIGGIRAKFPDTLFMIVGGIADESDRPYQQQLVDFLGEKRLLDKVIMTGYREDVFDLISAMDIVVHPPISPEPFGLVVLEAMYHEKPVVASRAGGIPEIVADGITGLLISPGNVQELTEAVCRLLGDSNLRARLGREGRKVVMEKFSVNGFLEKVRTLYGELLPR